MTPEAQNIALAEACGWTLMEQVDRFGNRFWKNGEKIARVGPMPTRCNPLPDFIADLNAQFEAWQKLTNEQKVNFRNWVSRVATREHIWAEEALYRFGCECLLRALGKWIE